MNVSATLPRVAGARVLQMGDHDLVLCDGTVFVTGISAVAGLCARFIASINVKTSEYPIMTAASRHLFTHARVKMSLAAATFALVAMSGSAHAQGVARGAEEGFYAGGQVLGPVGAVVGGAVGGVVGGVAGGVQGVLGIPQDTRTRAERVADNREVRVRRHRRHHVE